MKIPSATLGSLIGKPCYFVITGQNRGEDPDTTYHGMVTGFMFIHGHLTINIRGARQTETTGSIGVEEVEFRCANADTRLFFRQFPDRIFLFNTPFFLSVFENEGAFASFITQKGSRDLPVLETEDNIERFIDELTGTKHPA